MNYREGQAAAYLSTSRAWLRKMRQLRAGPPYVRINRTIIYRKSDLDSFLEKHVVQNLEPEHGGRNQETRELMACA